MPFEHIKLDRWVVATWRRNNVGGTDLVLYADDTAVTFATGPTPWGSGSWGPFPRSVVTEYRNLLSYDSWPVSGCPSRRWTPRDLLTALRLNGSSLADSLEQAIIAAEDRRDRLVEP